MISFWKMPPPAVSLGARSVAIACLLAACGPGERPNPAQSGAAGGATAGSGTKPSGGGSGGQPFEDPQQGGSAGQGNGGAPPGGGVGGSGGESIPSDPHAEIDAGVARVASERCEVMKRCYPGLHAYRDCSSVAGPELTAREFGAVHALYDEGRVTFDAGALSQCADDIANAPCATYSTHRFESCRGAFHGKANVGESCLSDHDCVGPLHCAEQQGACPGRCAEPLAAGAVCDTSLDCEDGLDCDGECGIPSGVDGLCAGAACEFGLICYGGAGLNGPVCKDDIGPGTLNGECDYKTACQAGLACTKDGVCEKTRRH